MLLVSGAQQATKSAARRARRAGIFPASIPIAGRRRLRFDPVYQRVGISANFSPPIPPGEIVTKISTTANRWQFLALVEAGLSRHLRFFVGPVVSVLTGVYGIDKFVNYPVVGTTTLLWTTTPWPFRTKQLRERLRRWNSLSAWGT